MFGVTACADRPRPGRVLANHDGGVAQRWPNPSMERKTRLSYWCNSELLIDPISADPSVNGSALPPAPYRRADIIPHGRHIPNGNIFLSNFISGR